MKFALSLLPLVLFAAAPAVPPPASSVAAVNQSTLQTFTKEGFRWMLLRASNLNFITSDRVEVAGMNLSIFTRDAAERIETILLSPQATFQRADGLARGENSVRIIRDDIEASGTKWSYADKEKRISLDGNVRVVFHAELKDILQ